MFVADGGRRSRLLTSYENHGEVLAERTEDHRFFDLRPSEVLSSLINRLVVEWSGDTVNWAKKATIAANFPVLEIADPEKIPFPGFDDVLVTHAELQAVVSDSRSALQARVDVAEVRAQPELVEGPEVAWVGRPKSSIILDMESRTTYSSPATPDHDSRG